MPIKLPHSDQTIPLARRLAVIIYDGLLLFAVLFFAAIPVTAGFNVTYDSPLYPVFLLYISAIIFLYYGWFWTKGQTLAMKTWDVVIDSQNRQGVSWFKAFQRFVTGWLPLGIWYGASLAGYSTLLGNAALVIMALMQLWAYTNSERATLLDLASGTRLYRAKESLKS